MPSVHVNAATVHKQHLKKKLCKSVMVIYFGKKQMFHIMYIISFRQKYCQIVMCSTKNRHIWARNQNCVGY